MRKLQGYRRSTDRIVMVEVKSNQYVNVRIALELGLIHSGDKIDVATE